MVPPYPIYNNELKRNCHFKKTTVEIKMKIVSKLLKGQLNMCNCTYTFSKTFLRESLWLFEHTEEDSDNRNKEAFFTNTYICK